MVGDIKEAAEVYEHGMSQLHFCCSNVHTSVFTVITADPTHNEAKMKLAEIYEILNEPRKALDLVLQGMSLISFEYLTSIPDVTASHQFSQTTTGSIDSHD